jgi:Methyltransferase domain
LEVGLAYGISALAILAAIKANGYGHHHMIDPFQRNYGCAGKLNVEHSGYGAISSCYERFPEEVIPQLPNVQFAFIDSSHLFDLTLMDFVLIDKKLDVGGVIVFHDLWLPAIRAAIRYVLTNRAYEIAIDLTSGSGAGPFSGKVKRLCGQILSHVPRAEQIFRGEVLKPNLLGNMVFLRKISEDRRDWRFHRPF